MEIGGVEVHLRLRDHGAHARASAIPRRFGAEDAAAPARNVAHHVAEVLIGRRDLDLVERLEQNRTALRCDGLESLNAGHLERHLDRKSTRLNSSHGYISYAVFCLKKKKTKTEA